MPGEENSNVLHDDACAITSFSFEQPIKVNELVKKSMVSRYRNQTEGNQMFSFALHSNGISSRNEN